MTDVPEKRQPGRLARTWREGGRFIVLVVALLAAVVLASITFGGKGGSVADWVAALSTLGALLAALVAAHYAGRTFTIERERDADRDEERRREQVARFAAWLGSDWQWIGGLTSVTLRAGEPTQKHTQPQPVIPEKVPVTIRNASMLPVHNLRLEFYVRERGSGARWRYAGFTACGLLPPETTREVVVDDVGLWEPMARVLSAIPGSQEGPSDLALGWSLRDNAGRTWRQSPGSGGPVEENRKEPEWTPNLVTTVVTSGGGSRRNKRAETR